jgi:hypothetical protein
MTLIGTHLHINSRNAWLYAAAVGAIFLAKVDDARAMSPVKPGTIIDEKMTIEAQWRHRHHQLRRRSRQQLNDEQRSGQPGNQTDVQRPKR